MRARRSKAKKALSRQEIIRNIYNETIEMVNTHEKEQMADTPRSPRRGTSTWVSSGWYVFVLLIATSCHRHQITGDPMDIRRMVESLYDRTSSMRTMTNLALLCVFSSSLL